MTTLGELLASPIRSGISRPRVTRGSGVPMINMKELFAFDYIGDVPAERVEVSEAELSRFSIVAGDLLFARQSLTFEGAGKVSLVEDAPGDRVFESHLLRARVDPTRADTRFLYYYFRTGVGRRAIESIIHQVAAAGIRSTELGALELELPGLPAQRAISEVLGALDNKIAANRRVLQVADGLIRSMFDRLLPDGKYVLANIADHHREQVSTADARESVNYVALDHLDRRSLWLARTSSGANVQSHKNAFRSGDTLFGRLRPYFHKVAFAQHNGVCSTDILVLRPKRDDLKWLVASATTADATIARAVGNSNGTRMPRASWNDIAPCAVPDPEAPETRRFNEIAAALHGRSEAAVAENRRIACARDELLPLLMSGRVAVKDAERRVGAEL